VKEGAVNREVFEMGIDRVELEGVKKGGVNELL